MSGCTWSACECPNAKESGCRAFVIPHRDLPRRMLAAVEDRVRLTQQQGWNARRRARAAEAAEILGILRNVVRAYESTETPV